MADTNKGAVSDPFAFLKEDHTKVAAMFERLADTTEQAEKTREEVFARIDQALSLHAELEEATLYPALSEKEETHAHTLEAGEEHALVKQLLVELALLPVTIEDWTAKMTVLKENVEHHVEEEETELFPKARKALSTEEQSALADAMNSFLENR